MKTATKRVGKYIIESSNEEEKHGNLVTKHIAKEKGADEGGEQKRKVHHKSKRGKKRISRREATKRFTQRRKDILADIRKKLSNEVEEHTKLLMSIEQLEAQKKSLEQETTQLQTKIDRHCSEDNNPTFGSDFLPHNSTIARGDAMNNLPAGLGAVSAGYAGAFPFGNSGNNLLNHAQTTDAFNALLLQSLLGQNNREGISIATQPSTLPQISFSVGNQFTSNVQHQQMQQLLPQQAIISAHASLPNERRCFPVAGAAGMAYQAGVTVPASTSNGSGYQLPLGVNTLATAANPLASLGSTSSQAVAISDRHLLQSVLEQRHAPHESRHAGANNGTSTWSNNSQVPSQEQLLFVPVVLPVRTMTNTNPSGPAAP